MNFVKIKPKRFFVVLLVMLFHFSNYAAWLDFVPQTIVQPDGTIIECYASGDEFYNWLHDKDGYTIIQSQNDGFYYYAQLEGELLFPSSYKVEGVVPATIGLSPWTNISPEKMKNIRADFLKNNMPEKPQISGYKAPDSVKNAGTLNNLVVYIRFSDQTEFDEDTMFYYNMFNNDDPGYNSMLNYYHEVSYQQLTLPSWFFPVSTNTMVISYQDIYEREYFKPYSVTNPNGYLPDQKAEREHGLLVRAINFISEEVPEELDIDFNNDGYVDNMVFNIRGGTTAWSTLLWPHRWVLYTENVYINSKQVYDYNFQIEERLIENGNGTLCHEMFHSLSAPDLYHYTSGPYEPVGIWDVMGDSDDPPKSMGIYMKYRYGGWIEEIPEISECGTYTLNPISNPENNCFKIASTNNNNQYFVLEYRMAEGIFEGGLPGTGLLVYRIDNTLSGEGNAQGPPDEIYLYRPDGTLIVDGNLNIAHFGADYNRTEINDNTNPSSFLQNGQPGGLQISNIGFVGETISFDVSFDKEPVADFEASETLITEGCSIDFYDLSVCDVDAWEWTFEGGYPATSIEQNPTGITYENEGFYNVTLSVANTWGDDIIIKDEIIHVSTQSLPAVIFYASDTVTCTDKTVQLMDFSMVCPESWNWDISPSTFEFVNGTSASSQNPEVQFNEAGAFSVSLTVTNANGSSSIQKPEYIYAGGKPLPFFDDFESGTAEHDGWTIINPDNDDKTWEIFNVSGNGGTKAAGINLFNYNAIFKRDQLISPAIDLSNSVNAFLQFDHAYALKQNPDYSDSLIVKISADCGNSWTRILELADDGDGSFATHTITNFSFIPYLTEDWCGNGYGSACLEADISEWVGQLNVMIMFESVHLVGNNLYIDNVSVSTQTGISDNPTTNEDLKVYPNPVSDIVNVKSGSNINKLELYNKVGKVVHIKNSNSKSVKLNVNDFESGIYFIKVFLQDKVIVKKIIIR